MICVVVKSVSALRWFLSFFFCRPIVLTVALSQDDAVLSFKNVLLRVFRVSGPNLQKVQASVSIAIAIAIHSYPQLLS